MEKKDREGVSEMLKLSDFIDVVIPRGGKGLIERVSRDSSIPVIKHLDGVCHVYVDDLADLETAVRSRLTRRLKNLVSAMRWKHC